MEQNQKPKIEPHKYGQLIFDNDNNTRIHNGERTVSLISGVGKPGYPHAKKKKKMKFDPYLTSFTNINSK